MPLRYINYKHITTSLALTLLGTPDLHSSPKFFFFKIRTVHYKWRSFLCYWFHQNSISVPAKMPEVRSSLKELDRWVAHLMQCEQLPEGQVKTLCEKVGCSPVILGKTVILVQHW